MDIYENNEHIENTQTGKPTHVGIAVWLLSANPYMWELPISNPL